MRGELPSYTLEKRYIRKDGSIVWVDMSVSLQRDAAGKPAYAIAIVQDISERKRLEAELRQAKEAAEAANRAKDEFLANVSHEIRTPMNAILGMTELVLDTPLTDDQRQCLKTVKSAADSLLGIINDLLDFSKIEAGKLELDPADFSLRAALGDTLRTLAMRAHRRGWSWSATCSRTCPTPWSATPAGCARCCSTWSATPSSSPSRARWSCAVEVAGDPAPDGEVVLRFAVSDTGIGIPPDKQERIFRAFEQEDTSTTRKYGGTGLGLTIAARLVALMGGTISVDSEPGRGSTFAFTARFGRQPHPSEPVDARTDRPRSPGRPPATGAAPLRDPGGRGQRVQLAAPGAAADSAGSPSCGWQSTAGRRWTWRREAPSTCCSWTSTCRSSTASRSCEAIREREQATGGHLPVIALTARSGKEDRERCLAAGMDDYLAKPVRAAELFAAIDRLATAPEDPGRLSSLTGPHETPQEEPVVRRVLSAAAITYVAATLTSVLTLAFYLLRARRVRIAGRAKSDVEGDLSLGDTRCEHGED